MNLKEFVVGHVLCSYPEDVIDRLIDYLDNHLDLILQVYDKTTRRRHLVQFLVDVLQFHGKQDTASDTIDFIVIALMHHGIYAHRIKPQRHHGDHEVDNDDNEEEDVFMIRPNGMVRLGQIEVALGWCLWAQNDYDKEQTATSCTTIKHSYYCRLVQGTQEEDIWRAVSGLCHLRYSPPAMTSTTSAATTCNTAATTTSDVKNDDHVPDPLPTSN